MGTEHAMRQDEAYQATRDEVLAKAEAARQHAIHYSAPYPQYDGAFDDMVPVRVTRRVRTKMGVAFRAGDVSVAEPDVEPADEWSGPSRTVWSVRNGIKTLIAAEHVEDL